MDLYNKDLIPLSDFSYWESKKLYTQLMEKFINGIIDGQTFEVTKNIVVSNIYLIMTPIINLINLTNH